jgi:teichuronic acid biosynthesis glycosyltransferase TuaC
MRVLSLTAIYPSRAATAEGRSVACLDAALGEAGIVGTTLVLRPWVPHWIATRIIRWRHLAIRPHVETKAYGCVMFSRYLHLPHRHMPTQCVRSMAATAIRLIEKHRLEFDLIHGQSIYPTALAARLVARRFRVPFVITLRDDLSHLSEMYNTLGMRRPFEEMFSEVSTIFVHGPALFRDMPRFLSRPSPKVVLAPNGVDFDGIDRILQALPSASSHSWGRIISVGNLYRLKGIHENLWALKMLDDRGMKDWSYTIVGDGPYISELKELTASLGLADRVKFAGKVPQTEAIRMIRDADIFSLPSWAESFGNAYAEAAVCGLPAVGCLGQGAELIIQNGVTGLLVPPKDVDALADALALLLRNETRAGAMGRTARGRIRRFTWEKTAQLYAREFARVVSNGIRNPEQAQSGTHSGTSLA